MKKVLVGLMMVAGAAMAAGPNADSAQAALKASGCTKCHAVDKTKAGPSFKSVAAKYKGKGDAAAGLEKLVTGGTHPATATGDVKNLVTWILAQ